MKFAPHAVLQFLCYDIFIQKGIRVAVTQNTGYFWWHFWTFQNKIGSSHDVIYLLKCHYSCHWQLVWLEVRKLFDRDVEFANFKTTNSK